jgi:poly(3-hydroxybutyrate) depolymerase
MNLDRHTQAHRDFYRHLIEGDGDSAERHRDFYDEYLAVMDLTAEFYLQTVDTAFIRHALPKGEMRHRGESVDPAAIRSVGLFTIEGEHDDISGVGQTEAAHRICVNIPEDRRAHYLQPKVGHYGVFNGSRFRAEIAPRITDFITTLSTRRPDSAPAPTNGNGAAKAKPPATAPAKPKVRKRKAKATDKPAPTKRLH